MKSFNKTLAALSIAATALVSIPAQADVQANGLKLNGFVLNGLRMNGLKLNGISINGISINGLKLNGLKRNGTVVTGLDHGTAIAVTLPATVAR